MKIFKLLSLIILQLLICLIITEIISYFYLTKTENPLFRARRILQQDQEIGWRVRSNLNTTFYEAELITNAQGFREKDSMDTASLLTLGPSSAFGWGVRTEQTYTSLTADALHMPVINAAQIGYSIIQGYALWEKKIIAQKKLPQFVILSFGINDLDKFRFYRDDGGSDLVSFNSANRRTFVLDRFEIYSNFATLLRLAFEKISLKFDCTSLAQTSQRVSLDDYRVYLEKFVNDFEKLSITPIIINTPYYLKKKIENYSKESINQKYAIAQQSAQQNQCSGALKKFSEAQALEPQRISEDVMNINGFLRSYCEQKKIPYVDAYSLLNSGSTEANYVDPVHPSESGHKLIADQVIRIIKNRK